MAAASVAAAATIDQWRTYGAVVQQRWRIVNFLHAGRRKMVTYKRETASFRVFVIAKSVRPVTIIDFLFFPTAGNNLPFAIIAAYSNFFVFNIFTLLYFLFLILSC